MLKIHSLTVSPFQSNCHLVQNEELGEMIVVDPGDDAPVIIDKINSLQGKVTEIWNTHGHIDHINANAPVKEKYGVPLSIHEIEAPWLESEMLCGAALFGLPFHPSKAETTWKGGEEFQALGHSWKTYHVPGHSPGSVLIVCDEENVVLAGDLVFRGSIGRMDLPGGSPEDMTRSLRSLFDDWGRDEWRIFCGHGPSTTVGTERVQNPLVREALERGFSTP